MIKVLFTSDYEIHGNGEGEPKKLLIDTTNRIIEQFEEYGAKLTIMADVAEIIRFKDYYQKTGNDKFNYREISLQLKNAILTGHDVQLHIHPSYYNSEFRDNAWRWDWSEYNLSNLKLERQQHFIKEGKEFLENLIKEVDPDYSCFVFRAANWSMMPSLDIIKALTTNNITFDTSVFKWGKREGLVNFDYDQAYSNLIPWPVDETDINKYSALGELFEFPIYSEKADFTAFISLNRFYRVFMSCLHKFEVNHYAEKRTTKKISSNYVIKNVKKSPLKKIQFLLMNQHALKADFNQCTGKQLIRLLLRAEANHKNKDFDIPFVIIGHSKLFNGLNKLSLKPFLKFVSNNPERFGFAKFDHFNNIKYLEKLRKLNELN